MVFLIITFSFLKFSTITIIFSFFLTFFVLRFLIITFFFLQFSSIIVFFFLKLLFALQVSDIFENNKYITWCHRLNTWRTEHIVPTPFVEVVHARVGVTAHKGKQVFIECLRTL